MLLDEFLTSVVITSDNRLEELFEVYFPSREEEAIGWKLPQVPNIS